MLETFVLILIIMIVAHYADLSEIKYNSKTNKFRDICFQRRESRFFTVLILNRNLKLNLN